MTSPDKVKGFQDGRCAVEVWGNGAPSHRCWRASSATRWADSYTCVELCGTHRRAADEGRGVWVMSEAHPIVGEFYKPGRLTESRPGFGNT